MSAILSQTQCVNTNSAFIHPDEQYFEYIEHLSFMQRALINVLHVNTVLFWRCW